jgi:hypothetical protein
MQSYYAKEARDAQDQE